MPFTDNIELLGVPHRHSFLQDQTRDPVCTPTIKRRQAEAQTHQARRISNVGRIQR